MMLNNQHNGQQEPCDNIKQVMEIKKNQFRVEIRKKMNQLQFSQKRQKLLDSPNKQDSLQESNDSQQQNEPNGENLQILNEIQCFIQKSREEFKNYIIQCCNDLKNQYENLDYSMTEKLLYALKKIRILVSQDEIEPQQIVLEQNIHPYIYQTVSKEFDKYEDIKYESAWILSNLVSKTKENWFQLVQQDDRIVNIFIEMFKSNNDSYHEIGIWGLGNLSVEFIEVRNKAIEAGCVEKLITSLEQCHQISRLKVLSWLMIQFCYRPHPFEIVCKFIPIIDNLLSKCEYPDIISNILYSLSYLSDGENEKLVQIIKIRNLKKILNYITHTSFEVVLPALRVIANILSGDEVHIDVLLNMGVLDTLSICLDKLQQAARFEASWSLSNILATGQKQIQMVLNHKKLINQMLKLIQNDHNKIQKELIIGFMNVFAKGNENQKIEILQYGFLKIFVKSFDIQDPNVTFSLLEFASILLEFGQSISHERNNQNIIKIELDKLNFANQLEALQLHPSIEIYNQTIEIIEKFYEYNAVNY